MASKNVLRFSLTTFTILLLINSGDTGSLQLGDNCTMLEGSAGVCTQFNSCASAKAAKLEGVKPELCSVKNKKPIVCCKNEVPLKCKKMCEQYADAVYVEEISPTLVVDEEIMRTSHCVKTVQELISGGDITVEKEFPHMAALGFGDGSDTQWRCGGSLISDRYILTAAHCIARRGGGKVKWALLGVIDYSGLVYDDEDMLVFPEEAIKMEIVGWIPHPDYTAAPHNDIALLKLKSKIQLNPHVRPACIDTKRVPVRDNVKATGWGTQGVDTQLSSKLMKVTLQVKNSSSCGVISKSLKLKPGGRGFEESTMICAGDEASVAQNDSFKDTCQGDSGGPIQSALETPYCMHSIVGVTSLGLEGCGLSPQPAIYTRVSYFVPWIESIVWPN